MVGQAFVRQRIAVIEHASALTAQPHIDVGHGVQLCQRRIHPVLRTDAFNAGPVHNSPATPARGLFHQQHPRTRTARRQRRSQTRNSAPNNKDIHSDVKVLVGVIVAGFRRTAKAGRGANDRLVHMFPERLRLHEGLVIETCGQKA